MEKPTLLQGIGELSYKLVGINECPHYFGTIITDDIALIIDRQEERFLGSIAYYFTGQILIKKESPLNQKDNLRMLSTSIIEKLIEAHPDILEMNSEVHAVKERPITYLDDLIENNLDWVPDPNFFTEPILEDDLYYISPLTNCGISYWESLSKAQNQDNLDKDLHGIFFKLTLSNIYKDHQIN